MRGVARAWGLGMVILGFWGWGLSPFDTLDYNLCRSTTQRA